MHHAPVRFITSCEEKSHPPVLKSDFRGKRLHQMTEGENSRLVQEHQGAIRLRTELLLRVRHHVYKRCSTRNSCGACGCTYMTSPSLSPHPKRQEGEWSMKHRARRPHRVTKITSPIDPVSLHRKDVTGDWELGDGPSCEHPRNTEGDG